MDVPFPCLSFPCLSSVSSAPLWFILGLQADRCSRGGPMAHELRLAGPRGDRHRRGRPAHRRASQSVALRTLLDDLLASRPIEVDAAPS